MTLGAGEQINNMHWVTQIVCYKKEEKYKHIFKKENLKSLDQSTDLAAFQFFLCV